MTDVERPSELVARLHMLSARHGLNIKQMAEKCGLPKSSLESYMKISGAKRPGVDALIAIADAMDVSMDWLVGRAAESHSPRARQADYALGCFNAVLQVLQWIREKQTEGILPVIQPGQVAGIPDEEVAARAMLDFVDKLGLFRGPTSDTLGTVREQLVTDLLSVMARQRTTANREQNPSR